MRSTLAIAVTLAGLLGTGAATAQSSSQPGATVPTMDKAALSKSCSTQADQKGLHGKARKRFRSACRRGKM